MRKRMKNVLVTMHKYDLIFFGIVNFENKAWLLFYAEAYF